MPFKTIFPGSSAVTAEALLHFASIVALILVILAAVSIIAHTLLNTSPPMPSSAPVRRKLVELIRGLGPRATIVELGSGWGTLSLSLARAFPGQTVIGYENSPVPYLCSLGVARLLRVKNLRLYRRDFFKVALDGADVIVLYLSPEAMAKLQPRLAARLKPGTVVISSTFALPQWQAERVVVADDVYRSRIYVYFVE